MMNILKGYGAEANKSETLFKGAIEERKPKKESPLLHGKKMLDKAKGATGALSDAMLALRERGEKIESLDSKSAELQNGAANYASMAKQLKEKNKKRSSFF